MGSAPERKAGRQCVPRTLTVYACSSAIGPYAILTSILLEQPTDFASLVLINNWMDEIKKEVQIALLSYQRYMSNILHRHLKGGLKIIIYHGPGRPNDPEMISDSDIVLTTYNTLTAEYQIKSKPSTLHRIGWYRVVLDEGG